MKTTQYFSTEYLQQCKDVSPEQTLTYLDDFRQLQQLNHTTASKLISMKVPETLLNTFRRRCELEGSKYQTQIKILMTNWLLNRS